MATVIRIPEVPYANRRLGRHIHPFDPRSLAYMAEGASQVVSVQHAAVGLPLDQGNLGSCTANALCGALNSSPNYTGTTRTEADAITLYGRETADEGEPYPPNDPGGTGPWVCQAAKELGWITSYQHALGLQAALQALVLRPVITGINWYRAFDTPIPNGQIAIAPGDTVRGGHEVVLDEIDVEHYLVGFYNSWGPSWGVGGRGYMSWHCWWRLLAEGGDVTVPIP